MKKDKYNVFQMEIEKKELKELYEFYCKSFNIKINYNTFIELYSSIQNIEEKMIGRFGGDIYDLLTVIVVRYISTIQFDKRYTNKIFSHIEIGTLFGGTAILTDYVIKKFSNNRYVNVMIDPLSGYYDSGKDPVSLENINIETLRNNIDLFQFNNYQIIQKYSTDQEVLDRIKEYKIISLYIDGDHFYKGIFLDWNNYSKYIIRNGYIIIDNYNDDAWPSVTLFVNKLLKNIKDKWKVIFSKKKTIVLQKVSDDDCLIGTDISIELLNEIEAKYFTRIMNIIQSKDKRINKQQQTIQNRENTIKGKESLISKLEEEINKQQQTIQNRENTIKGKESLISKLEEEINKQQQTIQNRENTIKGKLYKLSKTENYLHIILMSIEEIISKSILKDPIKKFKAYKKMLKTYDQIRGYLEDENKS
jgi:hypothetical protein